jgi:hypothetical protein
MNNFSKGTKMRAILRLRLPFSEVLNTSSVNTGERAYPFEPGQAIPHRCDNLALSHACGVKWLSRIAKMDHKAS